jgi:hypothetical protein
MVTPTPLSLAQQLTQSSPTTDPKHKLYLPAVVGTKLQGHIPLESNSASMLGGFTCDSFLFLSYMIYISLLLYY